MRIIVTGGQGFIGRHVCQRLATAGHDVLAVCRELPPVPIAEQVAVHCTDLHDPASLLPAGYAAEPFVLVHLAWNTDRKQTFSAAVEQPRLLANLLEYWTGRGLLRVVAAGSAEEYGSRSGCLDEDDVPLGRLSAYGWSKYSARLMMESWSVAAEVPALWLRPFVVYGPGQGGSMLIPYAVRQARQGDVAEFSDGQQQRDFIYVTDVAEAFARAAVGGPVDGFHVINLGTGVPTAVCDVVTQLGTALNSSERFRLGALPRRPGEPPLQVAALGLAESLLGWKPRTDLRTGLKRVVAARQDGDRWAA